jgi:hypothetical protein
MACHQGPQRIGKMRRLAYRPSAVVPMQKRRGKGIVRQLSRTRDLRQRQLPTDQDYAVSTREYQTDQSSPKPAPTVAGPVLGKRQRQKQRQKQPHRCAAVDRVTPYQYYSRRSLISEGAGGFSPRKECESTGPSGPGFRRLPTIGCKDNCRIKQPLHIFVLKGRDFSPVVSSARSKRL